MSGFNEFWDAAEAWQFQQFGSRITRGPLGPLKHLEKEAKEAQAALEYFDGRGEYLNELVDCLHFLVEASWRAGITREEFLAAAHAKLSKNKARKWGAPVEGQPCEHIKEEPHA